tara:strand:- start:570 stop:1751 length:1182 start_codon:yes stop_codon:yes gene_type:complete
MNVACLLLPNFRIQSELKRRPYLSKKQILISGFVGNKEVVIDHTKNISGISKGSLLKDVLMKVKNPVILEQDDQYYADVFDKLLRNLLKLFDSIEVDEYKCIYIAIPNFHTCLSDSSTGIAKIILTAIPERFNSHLGLSKGKYSSYIAALLSPPGKLKTLEFNKSNIRKMSAYLLPVSDELKNRMHFLGLTDFQKIANLEKKHLLFQFGNIGGFIWDFVNGVDKSKIKPLKIRDEFSKEIEFSEPTDNYDRLLVALESLLIDCFTLLQVANKYPTKISLVCVSNEGFKWVKMLTFKTHQYEKEYAINILKRIVANNRFSGPVEKIRIQIDEVENENGVQLNFFSNLRKESSLKNAINEFKIRFNVESPFYKIRDFEPYSRIPERRKVLIRYDS